MKTFSVTITSLDRHIFDGNVTTVTVPGAEGEMTMLAEHTALISRLTRGVIRYTDEHGIQHEHLMLGEGTVDVSDNHVTILV